MFVHWFLRHEYNGIMKFLSKIQYDLRSSALFAARPGLSRILSNIVLLFLFLTENSYYARCNCRAEQSRAEYFCTRSWVPNIFQNVCHIVFLVRRKQLIFKKGFIYLDPFVLFQCVAKNKLRFLQSTLISRQTCAPTLNSRGWVAVWSTMHTFPWIYSLYSIRSRSTVRCGGQDRIYKIFCLMF